MADKNKLAAAGSVIIKVFLFVLILGFLYLGIQNILKLNMGHRGTDMVKGLYAEKENTVDVLFLGASTMFCTADPLVLYEEYGIASFDYGSSAQPFELTYLFLQEALKYQHPKVVGLEVLSIGNELDTSKAENLNYGLTDLRFSGEKAAGVLDMFRNDKGAGLSYLIPMVQYKDRWQELTRDDFVDTSVNYAKGAYTPDKITETPLDFSSYYDEEEFVIPERNRQTLDKIVKLCRENGIELFLFKSPNIGWTINGTRAVEQLADEYDLPFVNYFDLMDELKVDPANDFRDLSHFNRFGSRKASVWLGGFLKEHYELFDWRVTDSVNSWDQSLMDREHDRKNEKVSRTNGLSEYLSVIPYQGHTVVFSVTGDTGGMNEFLEGLGSVFGLDPEKLQEGGSFAVQDGICISSFVGQDGEEWYTDLDTNTLRLTKYSISFNRDVYQLADNGLTILVYDNEWGQLADVAGFDASDPGTGIRPEN